MAIKEVIKIRNRGDITIPANIRNKYNLELGQHLTIETRNDEIVIKKLKL